MFWEWGRRLRVSQCKAMVGALHHFKAYLFSMALSVKEVALLARFGFGGCSSSSVSSSETSESIPIASAAALAAAAAAMAATVALDGALASAAASAGNAFHL